MGRLRDSDLARILDFVLELGEAGDLPAFRELAMGGLSALVPSDLVGYNELSVPAGWAIAITDPVDGLDRAAVAAFPRYMHQNPLIAYHQAHPNGEALRISDFLSLREFQRLGFYDTVMRPTGLKHQIAVTVPAPTPLVIGISINRCRPDFTARDQDVLNTLRPHLSQAYRTARDREMARLVEEGADAGVVLLARGGEAEAMTARSKQLLDEAFPGSARSSHELPAEVSDWARQGHRGSGADELPNPATQFAKETPSGRLVIRLVPAAGEQDRDVLILQQLRDSLSKEVLARVGLTRRESELLGLVNRGQTNAQIAQALFLSERTVEKHLQHAYAKLGATNRTQAVARARELLHTPSAPVA